VIRPGKAATRHVLVERSRKRPGEGCNPMTNADVRLRALLMDTIAVHQKSKITASPPAVMRDKKYNDQYMVQIAHRASLPEITVLLHASAIRENGLRLLKTGHIAQGAELLGKARRIFSEAVLSEETRLVAESFQYPAEAYLYFTRGEQTEAEAALITSIGLCQALRDAYDHEIEVRRIHLARNLIRVRAAMNRRADALDMGSHLVRYLEGVEECWPLHDFPMTRPPDHLLIDERFALMDQILGEIALLVPPGRAMSRRLVASRAGWLFAEDKPSTGEFAAVDAWLAARRAAVDGDASTFLVHTRAFFAGGRGYLFRAWRELTLDLIACCQYIAPDKPELWRNLDDDGVGNAT